MNATKEVLTSRQILARIYGEAEKKLPAYYGGGDKNPNELAAEQARNKARLEELQEVQEKKHQANATQTATPAAQQQGHPAIKTDRDPSTYMPRVAKKPETLIRNEERRAKLQKIVETSAPLLNVELAVLFSKRRPQELAGRRQAIIYFMTECLGYPMEAAAGALGLERTSAMAAKQRMEVVLKFGPRKEIEWEILKWLRKLCRNDNKPLPDSLHWPPEEVPAD